MSKPNQKSKQSDIAVEYLLEQLQGPEMACNPSKRISCLYVLKASFEKSRMPRVAELCFQRNILDTLMEMLRKEFDPRDKANEVRSLCFVLVSCHLLGTLSSASSF